MRIRRAFVAAGRSGPERPFATEPPATWRVHAAPVLASRGALAGALPSQGRTPHTRSANSKPCASVGRSGPRPRRLRRRRRPDAQIRGRVVGLDGDAERLTSAGQAAVRRLGGDMRLRCAATEKHRA